MIAITDPISPHETSSITTKDLSSAATIATRMAPMATTPPTAREPPTDNQQGSDASSDSAAGGAVKDEKEHDDDDEFESDDSEFGEDKASEELELLTLDDLGDDSATGAKPTATAAGAADAPPVKRIVRRKRKRMSEEERRVRHREVQRQFMKRKRARLAEMRKFIRGLDSQHRLLQAMADRARLEKENTDMREMLASPGSGWTWDDAPAPPKEPPQAHRPQQHQYQHPLYAAQSPSMIHLVPGHAVSPHGMLGFHPLGQVSLHAGVHAYPTHIPHQIHYQMPHPNAMQARHSAEHRLSQPGVPLPWDDIFDAVSTDHPGGPPQDFSF